LHSADQLSGGVEPGRPAPAFRRATARRHARVQVANRGAAGRDEGEWKHAMDQAGGRRAQQRRAEAESGSHMLEIGLSHACGMLRKSPENPHASDPSLNLSNDYFAFFRKPRRKPFEI
jgi:hypothetical protein